MIMCKKFKSVSPNEINNKITPQLPQNDMLHITHFRS